MTTLQRQLATAATRLARARKDERSAWNKAKQVAIKALEAGWPETTVASTLGVDRMTVRKWIGKR